MKNGQRWPLSRARNKMCTKNGWIWNEKWKNCSTIWASKKRFRYNKSIDFWNFFFKLDISYLWKQFVNVPEIFFQGQMELKVKQLEEAQQNIKFKPEGSPKGSFRSLPSTPCKESADSWTLSHLSQEIEEAKKQLKLKDQQILQLRAQVSLKTPPPLTSPSSDLEAKLFKSSLQIAERSKTSSISFQENKVTWKRKMRH